MAAQVWRSYFRAKNTTTHPLRRSKRRVKKATPFLPVLKTLVAPMLPDPMERISPSPTAFVSKKPNGIEPTP